MYVCSIVSTWMYDSTDPKSLPRCLSRLRVRLVIRKSRVRSPPGRQHSFVETDYEIFSTVIHSLPLIQEGQLSVCLFVFFLFVFFVLFFSFFFFFFFFFLLFLLRTKNICCGYSLEVPRQGASNEYPQQMFTCRNKENITWISPLIWSYVLSLVYVWKDVCNCNSVCFLSSYFPRLTPEKKNQIISEYLVISKRTGKKTQSSWSYGTLP